MRLVQVNPAERRPSGLAGQPRLGPFGRLGSGALLFEEGRSGAIREPVVVLVEPLASMSPSDVIELVAPTFQHYLVEPLTT